ncbi:MAG: TatD family hydrolase, partial [Actinomycetota bacterium]
MWFDSHCHLFDCEGPLESVLERAHDAGVGGMLVAGVDLASSRRALELARGDGVHAAVGVHPNSSAAWTDACIAAVAELLADRRAVAVGESGLDFYRDHSPPDRQSAAFAAHVELAKQHDKALII